MIERHVTYEVPADKADDFEEFFAGQYRPAVQEMPGLIECILLRAADEPTSYQMVFRWERADDAAAWRTSLIHQELQPSLNLLHTGMHIVAYAQVA